jgi:hypothetical protein
LIKEACLIVYDDDDDNDDDDDDDDLLQSPLWKLPGQSNSI